jgi:hypothetical protein
MVRESSIEQAQDEDQWPHVGEDNQATLLQRAHNLRQSQLRGQTATPSSFGGVSPLTQHIATAKQQAKAAPLAHAWGDEEVTPGGSSGGVTFKQGDGPNAMTADKFLAGQQRNAKAFGGVTPGEDSFMEGKSYTVQGSPVGQGPTDPMVNLVNQFKGALAPEALARVKAFADTGATPVQVHEALQHEMTAAQQQNKPKSGADERQATSHQLSMLEKQASMIQKKYPHIGTQEGEEEYKADPGYAQAKQQIAQIQPQIDQINNHLTEGAWKPGQQQQAQPQQGGWQHPKTGQKFTEGQVLHSPSTGKTFKIINGSPVEQK